MAASRLPKRCAKCGNIYLALPRERRCKRSEQRMGRLFYCWGLLVAEPKPKRVKAPKVEQTPQQAAAGTLDTVRAKIARRYARLAELAAEMGRVSKDVRTFEASAQRLARRASMTDAEIEAERQATRARFAKARSRRKTRAITLEG